MSWIEFDADHLLVTADQMEKIEAEVISRGFPAPALMEKVGQEIAYCLKKDSSLISNGVIVLVGPGHNGGDGLVVARELYLSGVNVDIWCPFPIGKKLTSDHLKYANSLGINQLKDSPDPASKCLWIDAIFGLGQTRPLPDNLVELFKLRQEQQPNKLVSLDIPSGICSDSGVAINGSSAKACLTFAVGFIKLGLVQDQAIKNVGKLIRVDIGCPKDLLKKILNKSVYRVYSEDILKIQFPTPLQTNSKYQRGRSLIVVGSNKYPGAAYLALKGALSSGVGSVQAALPELMSNCIWELFPEIVRAGTLRNTQDGVSSLYKFFEEVDLSRFDSLLIGPGIGISNSSEENWLDIFELIKDFPGLLVLDADALNRMAFSRKGWKCMKSRENQTWITPHIAEFNRLFPELSNLSPIKAVKEASEVSGSSVLLKGAHSIVGSPDGSIWQICDSDPYSARTGLGDLLAGFVTAFGALAVSAEIDLSSEIFSKAVLIHSQAAMKSRQGSSASDVANSLKTLVRELQSKMS